jgi:hypothetical protein
LIARRLGELLWRELLNRQDANYASTRPVVLESDAARYFGENSVVLAESGVAAWQEATATLSDDDGASRHEISVVRLHAEPLRVRVAAVA